MGSILCSGWEAEPWVVITDPTATELRNSLWEAYVFPFVELKPADSAGRQRAALEVLQMLQAVGASETNPERRMIIYEKASVVWQLLAGEVGCWMSTIDPSAGLFENIGDDPLQEQARLRALVSLQDAVAPPAHRGAMDPVALMLPRRLFNNLLRALRALRDGEVQPILAPTKSGRHNEPWSHDQARLRAVEHVCFIEGQGVAKGIARARVQAATKIARETLREWETEFGHGKFLSRLSLARSTGALQQKLIADPEFGKRDGDILDAHEFDLLVELTRREPLAAFGVSYRQRWGDRHFGTPNEGN